MAVRVLVVEDQGEVGRALKRLLVSVGAEVVLLEDAVELGPLLDREAFDVVISDLLMPAMTGVEVLSVVKARLPSARRCLMTATPELLTAANHSALGPGVAIVVKPWDDQALLAALGLSAGR